MKLKVRFSGQEQDFPIRMLRSDQKLRIRMLPEDQRIPVRMMNTDQKIPIHMLQSDQHIRVRFQAAQVIHTGGGEPYTGSYHVIPTYDDQSLPTKDKQLSKNVTVEAISVNRVSNPQGGITVYIGGVF